jgi:hypothetical protein
MYAPTSVPNSKTDQGDGSKGCRNPMGESMRVRVRELLLFYLLSNIYNVKDENFICRKSKLFDKILDSPLRHCSYDDV